MNRLSASAARQRLADHCLELVKIRSVTGDETEVTHHLEKWALSQPDLERDDVVRLGNGLIVGALEDNRPCVALVGHTDTVPAHEGDPAPSRMGERITGLGSSDMKGSIAVMMTLVESLELTALPFSLVLVFYDKEEGPYADNGLQPLLDNFEGLKKIDLGIAMEPTDNTLQLGCMGGIQATVTFEGKAAHSGRPWQGDNAVHKAGPFLTRMGERPFRDVQVEGLTFREAMSVTLAKGGRARNVIPDAFEMNVNYRFAPVSPIKNTIDAAISEVERMAEGARVEVIDVAPPGPVPVDNPILEHIKSHADLKVEPKQAWTDVARLAAHGIDAVNYGPGFGAQAHQAGEWISLDYMVESYDVLKRVLTAPLEGV